MKPKRVFVCTPGTVPFSYHVLFNTTHLLSFHFQIDHETCLLRL